MAWFKKKKTELTDVEKKRKELGLVKKKGGTWGRPNPKVESKPKKKKVTARKVLAAIYESQGGDSRPSPRRQTRQRDTSGYREERYEFF